MKEHKNVIIITAIIFLLLVIVGAGGYYYYTTIVVKKAPLPTETEKVNTDVKATAIINVTASGFEPATLQVKPETLVTWTNTDTKPHWIASDPYPTNDTLSDLNSKGSLQNGDSYSFNFTKAGTYSYHDNLDPYDIKGTVVVE